VGNSLSKPFEQSLQQRDIKQPVTANPMNPAVTGTIKGEQTLKPALLIAVVCIMLSPAAYTQTRRRSSSRRPPAAATSGVDERQAGAVKVADQVKNLTRFLYLYGGVAKELQSLNAAIQRGESSPNAVEQANRSKATIIKSLNDFRDGLDQLEIQFRTTPALQPYYIKLAGSAAGAANAAQLAETGQFDKSGRAMLDVVGRLTDVLVAMK
jgi:hypothetical protein